VCACVNAVYAFACVYAEHWLFTLRLVCSLIIGNGGDGCLRPVACVEESYACDAVCAPS
jgi:hypothetical protein